MFKENSFSAFTVKLSSQEKKLTYCERFLRSFQVGANKYPTSKVCKKARLRRKGYNLLPGLNIKIKTEISFFKRGEKEKGRK